jgi:hypothetical protein
MIWLLQNVVFSISLIVILHYLYIYFKATLTSPRVKDLIHCPKQKYETLFDTIERGNRGSADFSSIVPQGSSLGIPAHLTMHSNNLPYTSQHNNASGDDSSNINNPNHQFSDNQPISNDNMKSELKAYLKTLGLKKQSQNHFKIPSISN